MSPRFTTSWAGPPKPSACTVETIATKHRVLGASHPDTALTQAKLAAFYQNHRRFPEAEEAALSAYTTWQVRLGDQHPRTRELVQQIATLYDDWKKPDAAAHWRAKVGAERAMPSPAR